MWKGLSVSLRGKTHVELKKNRLFRLKMYFMYFKNKVQNIWYLEIIYFQI